jgi:hypothetical protein
MKSYLKPIAAAVSLALVSAAAHATLGPPGQGTAVPSSTGLYLEVYNSSGATELVNLSYAYSDIASGNLANLNSPQAVYATNVADPTGAADTVSQLDFGTIANAGTFATNSNYMIVSAASNSGNQTGTAGLEGVSITSGGNPSAITLAGMNSLVLAAQSEIADWGANSTSGTFFDAAGTSTASAANGPLTSSGNFNQGTLSAASIGTATAFYNILANTNTATTGGIGGHKTATTTYAGFWDLSSTGDLTYNIVTSPVPLPAAVWLLGSGLLGLIGVGRRRAA